MAYTKTGWAARQGTNLNKFTKSQETGSTVILENTPDAVSAPGTPFSEENMNHIEQGIEDAHAGLADEQAQRLEAERLQQQRMDDESRARIQGDDALRGGIGAEARRAVQAEGELRGGIEAEARARAQGDAGLHARIGGFQESVNSVKAEQENILTEFEAVKASLDGCRAAFDYLKSVVEGLAGPLDGSMALVTEGGDYIATESGEVIFTV